MTATTRRRGSRPATDYRVVQLTQHWTIQHGTYYRDCVVELSDGSLALYGIREDLLTAVAA
jgi:hypothetical protein